MATNEEDYQEFVKFIDEFFSEHNKNQENSKIITKDQNLKKLMKNRNLTKAIPGGIYGCALLLKYSNKKLFREVSMGRLHALIKTALENQVIDHYKTLIIKAQHKDLKSNSNLKQEINNLKRKFTTLLKENKDRGITLA